MNAEAPRPVSTPTAVEGVRLREALSRLPAYKAGKPAAPREGLTTYKVSSNENPYPPLPSVLERVRGAAGEMNRYPDMSVAALTGAIAEHIGVPVERIATGTGSVGVLGQIVQAMCDDGDEVIYAWRSFEAYPIVATVAGATPVPVPLTADARHDLDAMAAAVTERTKVILVCSPNNPTGPSVTTAQVEDFLTKVPAHVLVVLDEAYLEFVDEPDALDAVAVHRAHPNVAVLRTFSKAYGLAGLRVGYAVAHEPVAQALRQTAVPFGVNSLAQVAAIASLEAQAELDVRVAELIAERTRVQAGLAEQGWELPRSQANFVWFPLGADGTAFTQACDEAGLVVRQYGDDGVRVTIAEPEANDRLLEIAAAFRAQHGPVR
ncbi:histidinol-phosphate transaminase [Janibacter sp. G1551]|uniref:histidinol-phosphate transaminase n=1 Tax=Janibacter sp. G1551 TaxID=3420440 RepID=UPI003D07FAF0